MATITFDDGTARTLQNSVPVAVGKRFNGWNVQPVVRAATRFALASGVRHVWEHRRDWRVSFSMQILQPADLDVAQYLIVHLQRGGECTLNTFDAANRVYDAILGEDDAISIVGPDEMYEYRVEATLTIQDLASPPLCVYTGSMMGPPISESPNAWAIPQQGRVVATLTDYLDHNAGHAGFNVLDMTSGVINTGVNSAVSAINDALANALTHGILKVYAPAGTYKVDAGIVPKSGVTLTGAGKWATVFQFPQSDIASFNFSMIETTADLSGFTVEHIGFRGNAPFQTTGVTAGGTDAFAMYFGGQTEHLTIRHCRFYDLGTPVDDKGGGIVVAPTSSTKTIRAITVEDNVFDEIYNVCGVYMSIPSGSPAGRTINVRRNTFRGGGIQNCIYLAAGEESPVDDNVLRGVDISHNQFPITSACDICIEVNGVEDAGIVDNHFTLEETCTPILVRRAVGGLTIAKNVGRDRSGGSNPFISVVQFSGAQEQVDLAVVGNIGLDFANHVIQIDGISKHATVVGNVGRGVTRTTTRLLYLANCQNVLASENHAANCTEYARVTAGSGTIRNVTIQNGTAHDCGSSGGEIIATSGLNEDIEGLAVKRIRVTSPKAGTTHFVNVDPVAATGNVVITDEGDLPTTLHVVNPSHIANWRVSHGRLGLSADKGDANVTWENGADEHTIRFATTLTANRTVTLSGTNAFKGAKGRVVRTGLGAFTLDVGGLKTIPSATAAFVDFEHDGTAYRLTGYGLL